MPVVGGGNGLLITTHVVTDVSQGELRVSSREWETGFVYVSDPQLRIHPQRAQRVGQGVSSTCSAPIVIAEHTANQLERRVTIDAGRILTLRFP
jgi:hypothetical protein